jgi:hypothetical protein
LGGEWATIPANEVSIRGSSSLKSALLLLDAAAHHELLNPCIDDPSSFLFDHKPEGILSTIVVVVVAIPTPSCHALHQLV